MEFIFSTKRVSSWEEGRSDAGGNVERWWNPCLESSFDRHLIRVSRIILYSRVRESDTQRDLD